MRLLIVLSLLVIVTLVDSHGYGNGNSLTYGYGRRHTTCKACSKPKWQLVFKVVGGIATATETDQLIVDPYALWNREAPYNEDVAAARRLDTTFKGHYKSHLATNWGLRNIKEVKVALLDDKGKELISLIYDGKNTNKNNWFSATRLLKSPWEDIFTETRNVCAAVGRESSKRRFYINKSFGGCTNHAGWIFVGGTNTPDCAYERRFAKPQFLYSKLKTYATWNNPNSVGSASLFAIFIRTKCLY